MKSIKLSHSISITRFPSTPKRRRFNIHSLHKHKSSPPLTSTQTTLKLHDKNSNPQEPNRVVQAEAENANDSVVFIDLNPKPSFLVLTKTLIRNNLSSWQKINVFASTKFRSIILLNVITIIYASNIPVVKQVEAVVNPSAFTMVRFAIAAIPFLPFVFRARDNVRARTAGIELGFWVSLGYLMQALGLMTSDAGRASFITMFTVIVVPLIDGLLGAEVPARTWFGAFMSVVGVGMLESSGSPASVGDLLNFLSAVFFGVHMLRTERISRNTSTTDFLPLLGYELCVIAVFSTIWYFCGGWLYSMQAPDPSTFWHSMASFPWIPAIYTGVFSTGLCLSIEMGAMRDVSATETAIIYGLEPVWGACFAWFLLGERWGATGWIGAVLVLAGSLTVQLHGSLSPHEDHEDDSREVDDDIQNPDKLQSPVSVSRKHVSK